jgi:hypothetical protein
MQNVKQSPQLWPHPTRTQGTMILNKNFVLYYIRTISCKFPLSRPSTIFKAKIVNDPHPIFTFLWLSPLWRGLGPYPEMIWTTFDWDWPAGSGKDFFLNWSAFLLFCYYLPLGGDIALHLNNFECPILKDDLIQISLKLSLWFWRRLIDYLLFYVPFKNFSLICRRHHCRWKHAKLDLCSALRAFEQGGIFIVPHLLWHGPSFFRSHPKDHPI